MPKRRLAPRRRSPSARYSSGEPYNSIEDAPVCQPPSAAFAHANTSRNDESAETAEGNELKEVRRQKNLLAGNPKQIVPAAWPGHARKSQYTRRCRRCQRANRPCAFDGSAGPPCRSARSFHTRACHHASTPTGCLVKPGAVRVLLRAHRWAASTAAPAAVGGGTHLLHTRRRAVLEPVVCEAPRVKPPVHPVKLREGVPEPFAARQATNR